MKKFKKAITFLLTAALLVSVCAGLAVTGLAAGETITAEVQGTYTQSDAAQDITVRLNVNGLSTPYCVIGIDGGTTVPEGFTIKSFSTSNTAQPVTAGDYNTANGKLTYMTSDVSDTIPGDTYYEMIVTAPAGASGDYEIVFKDVTISGNYGTQELVKATATAQLNIAAAVTPVAPGYTVAVSAESASVEAGQTAKIDLDITSGDVSVYSNADMALTYDSANFTYDAANSTIPTGFEATANAGTVTVRGYGANTQLSDGAEIVLAFTAGTAEASECAFTLTSAKVDNADGASSDIKAATVTGSPAKVSIVIPAPVVTAVKSDYFGDYALVKATVDTDGYVPTYGGQPMFKVTNVTGQTAYDENAYYYVVKSADYAESSVGVSAAASAVTVAKNGDANGTGVIDINDAQFVYNLYNNVTVTYTVTVQQLLAADVNGDGTVNVSDCAAAVLAITA